MRTILKIQMVLLVVFGIAGGCTKTNFIKTGLSNGKHDCTMWEYFHTDSYNWDSTIIMIETAGLIDLFDGNDSITFFGPTNHSIRRYLLEENINSVKDMGADFCRTTILRHVMKGKVMRDDIPRGYAYSTIIGEGGQTYDMMGGNQIWVYTEQEEYSGVSQMGAVHVYLRSVETAQSIGVASTDIEPTNGVVHSLSYTYTLGEM